MTQVRVERDGDVAIVTLHSGQHGNALDATAFEGLRTAALRISDSVPRFVVLTAEGPDFCLGLTPLTSDAVYAPIAPLMKSRDAYRAQEVAVALRVAIEGFTRIPCPVITAIEGRCWGAGFELALCTDLRVLGVSSTLCLIEPSRGLITGLGGLSRLSTLIGTGRTAAVTLLGEKIDALTAKSLGLAHRVSPDGGVLDDALALVAELRELDLEVRQQALFALRQANIPPAGSLEREGQASARTWIGGAWQAGLPRGTES